MTAIIEVGGMPPTGIDQMNWESQEAFMGRVNEHLREEFESTINAWLVRITYLTL
ncbi:MAG: hypothetical protein ACRCZI_09755 [Cetobacterium sp.]